MAVHLAAWVVLAFCITGSLAIRLEHLHVKFAPVNGYFKIPFTVDELKHEGYVKMTHDDELNVDLYTYPGDPRVSVLVDTFGHIAGLRIAYLKSDVTIKAKENGFEFPYSYDKNPLFTSGKYYGIDVWHTTVLFISREKLKAGGREDMEGKVAEDVYITPDGVWTKIPKNECEVEALEFTKQGCYNGMGMHYFFKVTPDMNCNDVQAVFLLYERGELIGLGVNPFGSFTTKDREWFENVPVRVVDKIIPNGPQCLKEYVEKYGATALHIFFKKFPRLTFCTWPWQKSDQCKK